MIDRVVVCGAAQAGDHTPGRDGSTPTRVVWRDGTPFPEHAVAIDLATCAIVLERPARMPRTGVLDRASCASLRDRAATVARDGRDAAKSPACREAKAILPSFTVTYAGGRTIRGPRCIGRAAPADVDGDDDAHDRALLTELTRLVAAYDPALVGDGRDASRRVRSVRVHGGGWRVRGRPRARRHDDRLPRPRRRQDRGAPLPASAGGRMRVLRRRRRVVG